MKHTASVWGGPMGYFGPRKVNLDKGVTKKKVRRRVAQGVGVLGRAALGLRGYTMTDSRVPVSMGSSYKFLNYDNTVWRNLP